jgi:hypothetical protein
LLSLTMLPPTSGRSQISAMLAGLVTDLAQNAKNLSTWVAVPVVLVGVMGLLTVFVIEDRLSPSFTSPLVRSSLLDHKRGPWIPRLIGAAMLVLFVTATVLRKTS